MQNKPKLWIMLACLSVGWVAGRAQDITRNVALENSRVRATQLDYLPGTPREKSVRAADQVIVFLDDSRYERIDPVTGAKEVRRRKSGDVIWHYKGEIAPVLTNLGRQTYRTLVIELK
ncbi:MAG: hypothetical protein JWN34_2332 [Bryobacterales bacterium]|jgi:hypothetical protein|nr:hypothetical protein [Bryobacterales bacterium]